MTNKTGSPSKKFKTKIKFKAIRTQNNYANRSLKSNC